MTYRGIGECEDGKFDVSVEASSPADAFVEVALSVRGETTVDAIIGPDGRDVLDDIDPDDPLL